MIEQTLKLDRSKMPKITVDYLVDSIKERFKDTAFQVMHERKSDDGAHILQCAMALICIEKTKEIKVSFHVAVRIDVAFRIINDLKEVEHVKSVEVANVFYYDEKDKKIYYGLEAELKMLKDLKIAIVNEFIHEQTELIMLQNMKSRYVC